MKKTTILLFFLAVLGIVAGCKPSATKANDNDADSTQTSESAAQQDSTVYGVCTEGAMHTLVMKAEDGKVYTFEIDMDDSITVMGGILEGDQMAVTYRVDDMQDTIATKVINLTTLEANWSSLDKNFEIQKGGTVQSHQQGETQPWTSWRIFNGHLVLNKDTFDIDRLDDDSLFLENRDGIYAYSRVIKK